MKRERKGSRVILLKPDLTFLMLHFAYDDGVLAGTDYWGLPGGGREEGETPAQTAVRELFEETGIRIADAGPLLGESRYDFLLITGEEVVQHDYYYAVRVGAEVALSRAGFTELESRTLAEVRWWRAEELAATGERVVPGDLSRVLAGTGLFEKP